MNPPMLWQASVPVFLRYLERLRGWLDLTQSRLPAAGERGAGFDGLLDLIDRVSAMLRELPPAAFEDAEQRTLESQAGDALVRLPADEFLQHYALPNFFFHLATAYAILRSRGVPIGKADFDGLHAYPPVGGEARGLAIYSGDGCRS